LGKPSGPGCTAAGAGPDQRQGDDTTLAPGADEQTASYALTAVKVGAIAAPVPPAPLPSARTLTDVLSAAEAADVQTANLPAPKMQVIVLPPAA
jgi:hypothetical protein